MQYILANRRGRYDLSNGDPMRTFLEIPSQELTPLTVITEQELYFCLEYRTVEVRGLSIDLTATEFDLLSMMITNPRRVFTFEMIAALVWDMVCDYTTRRTISNHMGNLRRKLKIAPDVPDFIQNVRGVGYKFNKP